MSNLVQLIRASENAKKEEMVPTTVRIPMKLNSVMEALADQFGLSKQEMLLHLIEAGIEVAEDELKLNDLEEEKKEMPQADNEQQKCRFYILNTNKRHGSTDQKWMLTEGIAGAFHKPWKLNINRIKKGDVVFLYENGVGIVAYGRGTGSVLFADYRGHVKEAHYQKLDGFKVLSKPLSAAEIRKIVARNVVFLRVMSAMPDGQKVLDRIFMQEKL